MIVLDTTILLYALGGEHSLREPCRAILRGLHDGELRATTTVEVIQEFAHVYARRRPRSESAQRATEYLRALSPLVRPDEDDLAAGLELYAQTRRLGPFDTVLAALSQRRGFVLTSADRAFGGVAGLSHLDPGSPDFTDRLRAVGR